MSVYITILRDLLSASEDLMKFGHHEGECTNLEVCDKCGERTQPCTKHLGMMEERTKNMQISINKAKQFLHDKE